MTDECTCVSCDACRGSGRIPSPYGGTEPCALCGGTGIDMCDACAEAEDELWP